MSTRSSRTTHPKPELGQPQFRLTPSQVRYDQFGNIKNLRRSEFTRAFAGVEHRFAKWTTGSDHLGPSLLGFSKPIFSNSHRSRFLLFPELSTAGTTTKTIIAISRHLRQPFGMTAGKNGTR